MSRPPAASETASTDEAPVVASYIATYLKPEMLHIHRQVAGLKAFRSLVIARKVENVERFQGVVPRQATAGPWRFFQRQWRRFLGKPAAITGSEHRQIASILEQEKAALLHVYQGHYAVELLPLLRRISIPWVVSFHGADATAEMDRPGYQEALTEVLNRCRLALVRSDSLARSLQNLGGDQGKIRLQRAGIPLKEFAYCDRRAPSDGAWRLLQAGRFVPKKGLPETLAAFAKFRGTHPRAVLVLAGEGPLREELQHQAATLGLEEAVQFPGHLAPVDLAREMHRAHIFLHPSKTARDGNSEGVPNSMLEAMATGLPVVTTRHGGIPEAVRDGVNGRLLDENDVPALTRIMVELSSDYPAALALGRQAAADVKAHFELSTQLKLLEAHYREALQPVVP